jgi:hypothetical protein
MYCSVVYGYRNELAGYLLQADSPTLNADRLEELASIPWDPALGVVKRPDVYHRRVLFCGWLVATPITEWDRWAGRMKEVLRVVRKTYPRSLEDVGVVEEGLARIREDLNIEKAEYLLTSDRGASQVRGLRLQRLADAAKAAMRVVERVDRYVHGDPYAATMVGTNTFVFLKNLPGMGADDYMEFLRQLIGVQDDGHT